MIMMKTTKTFLISLCIFEVIFLGNTVGLAAGTYNGSANVSVKSGNLRPGNYIAFLIYNVMYVIHR